MAEILIGIAVGALFGAVAAGNNDVIKKTIENTVENYIKQTNKNVFNILNKSTMDISSEIINTQKSELEQQIGSGNYIDIGNVTIRNGSSIVSNQTSELSTYSTALINVMNDNELSASMTQQIINDITQKITKNADLQNDLKAVNNIEKTKKTEGEFNKLIDAIAGDLKSTDDQTTIKNKIMNRLEQIDETEINLTDIVNNYVKTKIDNNSINNCLSKTSSYNNANLRNLVIEDASNIYLSQTTLENNFYSCYLTNIVNNTSMIDFIKETHTKTDQQSDQGASAKNTMDVTNTIKTLEETTSIITAMLNTIIYVIAVIAILGFIILVGVPGTEALKKPIVSLFSKMKKAAPSVGKEGANAEVVSEVAKKAMKYFIGY
jgi:hypothetical protein